MHRTEITIPTEVFNHVWSVLYKIAGEPKEFLMAHSQTDWRNDAKECLGLLYNVIDLGGESADT